MVCPDWNVFLTDFGHAINNEELKRENKYTRIRIPGFFPIEMFVECLIPDKITYDHIMDIWSMGITIYELIYGKTPFNGSKDNET